MSDESGAPAVLGIVHFAHTATYEFPIKLREGDKVRMVVQDDEFPDFWWCVSLETGNEGWVPFSVLTTENNEEAVAVADYSAVELTVEPGDEVTVHADSGGWLWCENESGEFGWVPTECVDPAPDH